MARTKKRTIKKYNLIYMAKPIYGGWVSFTTHLSLRKKYNIYKISNRTETKNREYGYDVTYRNLSINDILKLPNILITAIDKKYYKYLEFIKNATIVIHDPTELKPEVISFIKRNKIITIRKTVQTLLKKKYNIDSIFLYHPFYEFPISNPINISDKRNNVSISRIDFDKNIEIIVNANNKLHKQDQVKIFGALNDLYVYHKLRYTNFKKYYYGRFGKRFEDIYNILNNSRYVIDLSSIKNDGGGSQYTFLEAIYFNCILILNKKWVDNTNSLFVDNHNCFIIQNENDLIDVLQNNISLQKQYKILNNSRKLLNKHIKSTGW